MSQTLSPSVMASITQMVVQQLQQGGVVNQFARRPDFLGPESNNALVPYSNSPRMAQAGMFPIEDARGAPRIRRTLSSTSTSSTSQSLGDDEDFAIIPPPKPLDMYNEGNDMDMDVILDNFSGKKIKAKYLPEDKIVVNDSILRVLDPLYLAPLHSDLFKRFRVKTPDANGFRRLKKNPDIVMPLFKRLTKSTLRRLLALAENPQENLRQRYFYAALAVTTKRRANHIQSWRLNGGPLSFCYGGKDIYIAKYGDPCVHKKSKVKVEPKVKPEKNPTPTTSAMQTAFSFDADFSADEDGAQEQLTTVILTCNKCKDEVTFQFSAQQKPHPKENFTCVVCLAGGKAKCAGCGKFFKKKKMFPKCEREFKNHQETLRCNFCWQTLVKNKILPDANARVEKIAKDTGKESKNKTVRACKCGSTTHKTANSRLCPLNKRYNQKQSTYDIFYIFRTCYSCYYLL